MPLPLNPSPPEIQFPSNKRQRGFSDLAETRIVAGIALVLLVVTTVWLLNRYVAFRPDKEADWLLWFGLFSSLATVIVFAGMFLREEKQVVSQGAPRFLPLSFSGRGRDVFSPNGLIAIVSVVSIIGIPVWEVFTNRWIARNTQTQGGKTFTFVGSIGVAYVIAGLGVAAQMVEKFAPWDRLYAVFTSSYFVWIAVGFVTIFCYALAGAVYFIHFRYYSENIRSSDGKRLGSVVRFFPFVGFQLLSLFSLLTVVGWAWLTVWYTRWIAKQLIAPGVNIRFVGSGFQLLWRTVAACVASVPLLTIPWTISWFLRWYITSFEISQTESSPSAVASTEV